MNILKISLFCGLVLLTMSAFSKSIPSQDNSQKAFEIDSTDYNGEIDIDSVETPVTGSLLYDSASIIPNHLLYHIWMNNLINPYNVDLTAKTDTTFIYCKGYCSPIVNRVNSDFGFRHWKFH